jgi:hypothetical protein
LIGGYSIGYNPKLLVPFYLTNAQEFRDVLTREALFSFSLAGAGFLMAGPVGVLAGHIFGAAAGYARYRRIEGT